MAQCHETTARQIVISDDRKPLYLSKAVIGSCGTRSRVACCAGHRCARVAGGGLRRARRHARHRRHCGLGGAPHAPQHHSVPQHTRHALKPLVVLFCSVSTLGASMMWALVHAGGIQTKGMQWISVTWTRGKASRPTPRCALHAMLASHCTVGRMNCWAAPIPPPHLPFSHLPLWHARSAGQERCAHVPLGRALQRRRVLAAAPRAAAGARRPPRPRPCQPAGSPSAYRAHRHPPFRDQRRVQHHVLRESTLKVQ